MIKRIELKNFMSHEHTMIEPAAGLTVLIGPNNVGKSAIIAALQILCYNENSTYVMRHGTKDCSVSVETDDDHYIEWRRKKSPSYVIDGQKFDRLARNGVPDELHQSLRLAKVDANSGDAFDIHFGSQKTPIFLLDQSGAAAARFFASSSDAIRLVAMQQKHKDKVRDAKRQRNQLDEEAKQLNSELAALEPVVAIEKQVGSLEDSYQHLIAFAGDLDELQRLQSLLAEQSATVSVISAENAVLSCLTAPPQLSATESLDATILQYEDYAQRYARSSTEFRAMANLALPPQLEATEPLNLLVEGLARTQLTLEKAGEQETVFQQLNSPPLLNDVRSLSEQLIHFIELETVTNSGRQQLSSLATLEQPPALHDWKELESTAHRFRLAVQDLTQLESQNSLLTNLVPLELQPTDDLDDLVDSLKSTECHVEALRMQIALINQLDGSVDVEDFAGASELYKQLVAASGEISTLKDHIEQIQSEIGETVEFIRQLAEGEACPVCGSALSAEKLIERASGVSQ